MFSSLFNRKASLRSRKASPSSSKTSLSSRTSPQDTSPTFTEIQIESLLEKFKTCGESEPDNNKNFDKLFSFRNEHGSYDSIYVDFRLKDGSSYAGKYCDDGKCKNRIKLRFIFFLNYNDSKNKSRNKSADLTVDFINNVATDLTLNFSVSNGKEKFCKQDHRSRHADDSIHTPLLTDSPNEHRTNDHKCIRGFFMVCYTHNNGNMKLVHTPEENFLFPFNTSIYDTIKEFNYVYNDHTEQFITETRACIVQYTITSGSLNRIAYSIDDRMKYMEKYMKNRGGKKIKRATVRRKLHRRRRTAR